MKPFKAKQVYYVIGVLLLSLSFAEAHSQDSYTPPQLNLTEREFSDTQVQERSWDDGLRFQINENPYSERAIASDQELQDEISRDPSSEFDPLELNFETDVKKWRWEDIEHQP